MSRELTTTMLESNSEKIPSKYGGKNLSKLYCTFSQIIKGSILCIGPAPPRKKIPLYMLFFRVSPEKYLPPKQGKRSDRVIC